MFTEEEEKKYEKDLLEWISEFKGKTWRNLWISVSSSNKTWDSYSLSTMYLVELDISGLLQLSKKDDETFLTKYVGLLKKNILSKPSERQLPSELRKEMYSIFTSVNKGNYNNTMKKFTKAVKENKQAIVKNRIKENLQTLQEEKQIHKKFNHQ